MQIPSCSATYFALSSAIVSTSSHGAHQVPAMALHRGLLHSAVGALAGHRSSPARSTQLLKFLLHRADLRAGEVQRCDGRSDGLTWCSSHCRGAQESPWPARVRPRDLRRTQRPKSDQVCATWRLLMQIPSWLAPYFALNYAVVSATSHDAPGVHRSSAASRTQLPKFLPRCADLHVPARRGLGTLTPSRLTVFVAEHHTSASGRGPPRRGWC